MKKKGKQSSSSASMMVALNEGHEVISKESTTLKLSAVVAVRNSNDNKVFANEMVNNLLTFFMRLCYRLHQAMKPDVGKRKEPLMC